MFSAGFKECSTPQGEQVCNIPASIAFVIPQRPLVRGKPLKPLIGKEKFDYAQRIFFAIGFLIGALSGIVLMCLLQINCLNGKEEKDE